MRRFRWFPLLALGCLLTQAPHAAAQYIGFVYPAGGQLGTTVKIKLGGQRLIGLQGAVLQPASASGLIRLTAGFHVYLR